jgi:uncharacterized protein YndB with AHSA1/START domain
MPTPVEVTTPSPRAITVKRTFDAPARLVFDCHTKPDLVRRWATGPDGWTMSSCDIDFRVGGTYRYVWRNDENGFEFGAGGVWKEIDAPNRIVHTEKMDGFDGESLCTYALTEAGGRTTLTLTMEFDSEAARDGAVKSGMTDGMAQSYDRLDAVLREAAG